MRGVAVQPGHVQLTYFYLGFIEIQRPHVILMQHAKSKFRDG